MWKYLLTENVESHSNKMAKQSASIECELRELKFLTFTDETNRQIAAVAQPDVWLDERWRFGECVKGSGWTLYSAVLRSSNTCILYARSLFKSLSVLKVVYQNIFFKFCTLKFQKRKYFLFGEGASGFFPRLQPSHDLRRVSTIHRDCLLLILKAYKKTSTSEKYVLKGILPLNLSLKIEAISLRLLRLNVSTENYNPMFFACPLLKWNKKYNRSNENPIKNCWWGRN